MADTTSGARGATRTAKARRAADSPENSSAPATTNDAQPTSATVPATVTKRSGQRWTPSIAREILSQSVINARDAGLDVRVYESTRGTVVIELMAHGISDGWIVPAKAEVPA